MADTIKLKVDDLYKQVRAMRDDGMEYVELYIMDKEACDDGDIIPKTLSLSATSDDPDFCTDYEMLEEV